MVRVSFRIFVKEANATIAELSGTDRTTSNVFHPQI